MKTTKYYIVHWSHIGITEEKMKLLFGVGGLRLRVELCVLHPPGNGLE